MYTCQYTHVLVNFYQLFRLILLAILLLAARTASTDCLSHCGSCLGSTISLGGVNTQHRVCYIHVHRLYTYLQSLSHTKQNYSLVTQNYTKTICLKLRFLTPEIRVINYTHTKNLMYMYLIKAYMYISGVLYRNRDTNPSLPPLPQTPTTGLWLS